MEVRGEPLTHSASMPRSTSSRACGGWYAGVRLRVRLRVRVGVRFRVGLGLG